MKKKCNHNDICWEYSQFNPDVGYCRICNKLLYAENASSALHSEDEPEYKEIILNYLRNNI